MKRRPLIFVVVVLAAAALWWVLKHSASSDSAEAKPTAHVSVAPLKVGPIAQTLEAFGVVEPTPGSELVSAAPFDCVVTAVHVEPRAHVGAGDVLLEIAPSPDAKLTLESARNAHIVAAKALIATQERFDLKLATDQELNVARQTEADAQARLQSLQARGLGADGKIRAAAEGVVNKLEVTRGSLVVLGAPLVSVATSAGLEARLALEGSTRRQLARNQRVTLTSADSANPLAIDSSVRAVGAALNATSGTLEVRVPVPADAPLMLGEHVRALIEVRKLPAALLVPRSAVLPQDGAQVLYTVKDGKAVRHEVTLGIEADDELAVQAPDLQAGATVVTTGNYELSDGMAVQIDAATKEPLAGQREADKEP